MALGPGSNFAHGPTCECRGCALERRVSELEVSVTALWERLAQLERPTPETIGLPGQVPFPEPIVTCESVQVGHLDEYDELMSGQPGWMP